MPHRYLPEHVVLNEISKPASYTEPLPSAVHASMAMFDIAWRAPKTKVLVS
jgi:hypothetical protein